MDEDILSAALSLEDSYYSEGFTQGTSDGSKAGLYEGRHFGLTQAYTKFHSLGHLHGRAIVWNSRSTAPAQIPELNHKLEGQNHNRSTKEAEDTSPALAPGPNSAPAPRIFLPHVFSNSHSHAAAQDESPTLSPDPDSADLAIEPPQFLYDLSQSYLSYTPVIPVRARKHVSTLYALTEPESLALENSEHAVSDLEDRAKRALAKAGLVGRMLGERVVGLGGEDGPAGEGEVEDIAARSGIAGEERKREDRLMVEEPPGHDELEIEIH